MKPKCLLKILAGGFGLVAGIAAFLGLMFVPMIYIFPAIAVLTGLSEPTVGLSFFGLLLFGVGCFIGWAACD